MSEKRSIDQKPHEAEVIRACIASVNEFMGIQHKTLRVLSQSAQHEIYLEIERALDTALYTARHIRNYLKEGD